ncbi:gibberellin 2-beta-dioxygenase 8 [Cinnamomum micranthum f. kanehirae]|uniref:gibberellin 2beta-dioxygenase n=1 Tax=Cinnamomum micranthum f. kanehirae TaxID=337451 RepID=A0A443PI74_9MAGN|nr:gibberellin 2-beta-dioxygenase 8 [Cinnamomum micranthum f. kanehirae]
MLDSKMKSYPPLIDQCKSRLDPCHIPWSSYGGEGHIIAECQLPLIDLRALIGHGSESERHACEAAIVKASSDWGFFQVLNHGISQELLEEMRREQKKLFELPQEKKVGCRLLNNSYRWGTPTATSLKEFSWSEAFHIPLTNISEDGCFSEEFNSIRKVMEKVAIAMSDLARLLAGVLTETLGHKNGLFLDEGSCFLRLNRYPQCPFSQEIHGLVPHTDSDFLTILDQDQVGGLHLMKDSKWVSVKPNPKALVVNIGDLFQAWSNDVYKSVEHKVMANSKVQRYSMAYFLCPSCESMIGSCKEPSLYKKFTFGEYRQQVQQDVKKTGRKVGLPRFLL